VTATESKVTTTLTGDHGSRGVVASAHATEAVITATAYDVVSARIVEEAGFGAVFCSGYGHAASALGKSDSGQRTLDSVVEHVRAMSDCLHVPLLADADTGFDDPADTVRRLAAAGASAVMIEDQVEAKQCGHIDGKRVVPIEEMVARLESAIDACPEDVRIIARTDAIGPLGLREALSRANVFAELGADVIFVEAPRTIEELVEITRAVDVPLMVNLIPGGKTPLLSVKELTSMGFRLIVYGLVDLMFAAAALRRGFHELATRGDIRDVAVEQLGFDELNRLTGLVRS
jgi:2,3-dimethylmalate lyase